MPYYYSTPQVNSIQWDKHKRVLMKVQRRAAQYHTSRKTIPWETLEQRRMKARLVMGTQCKMLYSRWSVPPKHTCNQRPRHKAHTDICKKNYYQGTFFSSLIPLWNQWPETVASATSLEDFKMDGWTVFRPFLCTVKAELGRGQPGLMRWIWDETLPQSSIDRSTFYSAAHRATKWASGRP